MEGISGNPKKLPNPIIKKLVKLPLGYWVSQHRVMSFKRSRKFRAIISRIMPLRPRCNVR